MATSEIQQVDVPAPSAGQERYAWRLLALLLLANLFNFFDRTMPAIVIEQIRLEFDLKDVQIGVLASAFTLVYAIAGFPLGRLADRTSRKKIIGWGLAGWSLLTAATGLAFNYGSLLLIRLGVGIGEASYAPAATSLIADAFPAAKRGRATGVFMLGLPLGLVLAYFTVGGIAQAFGSWRAPFFIAAVPGLLLALAMFAIREPARGAVEEVFLTQTPVDRPLRRILTIPTMWCLIVAGLGHNFAAYSTGTFMVPLLQRYFGLPLSLAAVLTGLIVGVTGLIGLTCGGWAADRAHRSSANGRMLLGAICVGLAVPLTLVALLLGPSSISLFVPLFGIGWLLSYVFYTTVYPTLQDVVDPRLRGTAMAVLFGLVYLLGGGAGPVIVGALSDTFARQAMIDGGGKAMTESFRAIGLRGALFLIPIGLVVAAASMFAATRTVAADSARLRNQSNL